ncbi:E3 ubiquitin-protein ligase Topors-like [Peromyscus leucopus]|uniref:E3 ubiquitin-protein ligase Topors-like n=1 Tax=Peromyscus leucopus TaxID=10041 RepID=UPI0010A18001|nr:E3 ubiquitin-protein ligase Topors-like [Peromyscus leucopus]
MAMELSSNCECPNCLEGIHSESNRNSSRKKDDGAPYARSSKKSTLSPIMKRFLSQCYSNRLENGNKEDPGFLPSERESSMGFSQRQNLSETSKNTKQKTKPLRELTIQELLRKFGDGGKFQPYSKSLGHFRDHGVVKFRRALYYSGIWVKRVQSSKLEKHFSANYFKRNPSSLHRLIPWLKRELTAVYGDNGYTVKNVLAAILHHMTIFNLNSESFTQLLEPYLLQHTHHFLHEFISFVYSSYNLETYDRSAVYQCPVSKWMKNKNVFSTPVLSLPEDFSLVVAQQGTKRSKNTRVQWNKTRPRPHSSLKQFPNGSNSSRNPKTSTTHQKTADKFHVWTEDEWELDDFKDVVCTTNLLLDWDNLRESSPGTECYKNDNQEKKAEGKKLLPGHVQAPQRSRASSHISGASVDSNRVPPRKYNLRERNVVRPGQQVHYQKKEKKKLEESSPKGYQRLPRERTLINSKSRETDHSSNCISGNFLFPTRNDKMLGSSRKKKRKYSQSSQYVEVGSQQRARTQSRSSSRTPRSESWCVGSRKRSISRDRDNLSTRGNHRRKCLTQNIRRGPSRGSVHGCESAYRMASLTPGYHGKVCLTSGRRHSCASAGNCDSQVGRECDSLTGLQTEKYQFPSKQQKKGKNPVIRARRIRTLGPQKPHCQCVGTQTTAQFCVELGHLSDQRSMNGHFECVTSCRK